MSTANIRWGWMAAVDWPTQVLHLPDADRANVVVVAPCKPSQDLLMVTISELQHGSELIMFGVGDMAIPIPCAGCQGAVCERRLPKDLRSVMRQLAKKTKRKQEKLAKKLR